MPSKGLLLCPLSGSHSNSTSPTITLPDSVLSTLQIATHTILSITHSAREAVALLYPFYR